MKLFDMKKFQQNVNRELKRQRPERNKLESQVIFCYPSLISITENRGNNIDSKKIFKGI